MRGHQALRTKLSNRSLMFVSSLFLCVTVITPALRPAEKYLGSWLWWVPYSLLCMAGLIYVISNDKSWLAKLISSSYFIFGVPVVLALVSTIFYPLADALKVSMQGQDQDDCTILGIEALTVGANPVATATYFGNPCSNLLGAILPHAPFVLSDLMGLAGPAFFLATVAYFFRSGLGRLQLGLFVAIISGTPGTLELMVNGSDFVFIGFGALWSLLALNSFLAVPNSRKFSWLAVIVSLVASSRINMPIFAVPFGIALLGFRRWNLPFFATVAFLILVPNGLVYLSSPSDFAPLHLIGKGQTLVPGAFYPMMIVVSLALIGVAWYLFVGGKISTTGLVLFSFAPHLMFLAYGDLIFNRQLDIFWWEGANYLFLITPLCAYAFLMSLGRRFLTTT